MMFWSKAKIALIAAVIVFAVTVPPALLETRAQPQTNSQPVPATPAPDRSIRVDFPRGASIELPCLVGTGAEADKTWALDGTPLNPPPIQIAVDEKGLKGIYLYPGQRIVQMPVQSTGPNGSKLEYFIMAGNNAGFSGQAMRDGKPLQNFRVWGETFDSTQKTHWVQLRLELDPWQLLATWDSHGNNIDMTTDDTNFDVQPTIPAVRDGQLVVSLTEAYDHLDWNDRIFAILKDGSRLTAVGSGGQRLGKVNVERFSFSADKPLNPDDVTRYELEVTPLTLVAINNISLFPNQLTHPTIKVTTSPALFKLKPSLNQPGGL